jgi:CSLREA domain-containing protein
VVTTTANTFDGTCDAADCSLRDAVAAANALTLVNGLPNQITVPAGTYTLSVGTSVPVTQPLIINGAGAALTTIDISGSTVPAPGGVLDAQSSLVLNGLSVTGSGTPATDVLASCVGHDQKAVSLLNGAASGLAAVAAACDTTVVSSTIVGPTTAIDPYALSVSNSTVPFASTTIQPARVTLVASIVTGPSTSDGSTSNATVSIQPRTELANVQVAITASRLVGVGLQLGGLQPGAVTTNVLSTSFGMSGPGGPVSVVVGEGTTARVVNSTVYGGGAAGALRADGALTLESATLTTNGPTLLRGANGTISARRSILSATSGSACSAPITSLGRNLIVGSSCGADATDTVVANEAALGLGTIDLWSNPTPSLHRLPAAGSPAIDAIPTGPVNDPDCPTDASGGRSIDARGVVRPQGTGCDIGALEVVPAAAPA